MFMLNRSAISVYIGTADQLNEDGPTTKASQPVLPSDPARNYLLPKKRSISTGCPLHRALAKHTLPVKKLFIS